MEHLKKIFNSLFYVPKHEKVSDISFSRIILSSVLGISLCIICLAGLTWAWFTSSVTSSANTITAADFSVEIEFKQNESVIQPETQNESYELNNGEYEVTVTASGTVSTGYCKVELKLSDTTTTYHTIQLYPAGGDGKPKSVEFTVDVSNISYLKITPQWGTYAKQDGEALIGESEEDIKTIPIPSLLHLESETEETEKAEETQTNHLTESEPNSTISKTTASQPATTESTVSELSSTETPKQTEESSSAVSTESSSQETELEETTVSETQTVPNTGTTVAETNEP